MFLRSSSVDFLTFVVNHAQELFELGCERSLPIACEITGVKRTSSRPGSVEATLAKSLPNCKIPKAASVPNGIESMIVT